MNFQFTLLPGGNCALRKECCKEVVIKNLRAGLMFGVRQREGFELLAAGDAAVHRWGTRRFELEQSGDDEEAGESDIGDGHLIAVAEDAGIGIAGKAGFHGSQSSV
jgi:hypothetical protein